jgi:glucose-1-phosphate cytidylyltransferase
MKVVILCGGSGIRLDGAMDFIPKALIPVQDQPILYHIFKHFAFYGFTDFILCTGYQGHLIQAYLKETACWNMGIHVEFIDTGIHSMTGHRLKQIESHLDSTFILTYSDLLSDINVTRLIAVHRKMKCPLTMTGAHPTTALGFIYHQNGLVHKYSLESAPEIAVKGGYFVCEPSVFSYIKDQPECIFEQEPIQALIQQEKVAFYDHSGFWKHFETSKQVTEINSLKLREKPIWSIENDF